MILPARIARPSPLVIDWTACILIHRLSLPISCPPFSIVHNNRPYFLWRHPSHISRIADRVTRPFFDSRPTSCATRPPFQRCLRPGASARALPRGYITLSTYCCPCIKAAVLFSFELQEHHIYPTRSSDERHRSHALDTLLSRRGCLYGNGGRRSRRPGRLLSQQEVPRVGSLLFP